MAISPRNGAPRVVLVNPPPLAGRTNDRTLSGGLGVSRKLKPFEREPVAVPPIDVLYLAAMAEHAGASVAIVDLLLERISARAAARRCVRALGLPGGPAPWIGVRISMPSLLQDIAFADRLKAAAPEAIVFVFGAAIMATIDQWIRAIAVDYVFYGEPEAFFPEALAAADPRAVPGVIAPADYVPLEASERYDEAKNSARYARWIKVARPSSLPRPAWHLLDLRRYADGDAPAEIGVQVQASRGCPFACTMCPYMLIEGTEWRKHDVDEVVDQLEHLNRTYGIHRVRFRDANFGISRQFAGALAEAIIARGIHLDATIETSVEVFDEPTLRRLFDAGVRTITTGVETNDAACMASIGQKIKVNTRLQERVALCHAIGYRLYGTYCLGMPEETWDSVEGTWRFANALDIESGFTVLTPFPGTPMYWRAMAEGLLPPEMQFSAWNSYTATVRTYALSTTDLNMARWWARLETILPFRRTRAAARGRSALLRFYLTHVPHYGWRQACRLYVWWRRRWPAPPAGLSRTVTTAAA